MREAVGVGERYQHGIALAEQEFLRTVGEPQRAAQIDAERDIVAALCSHRLSAPQRVIAVPAARHHDEPGQHLQFAIDMKRAVRFGLVVVPGQLDAEELAHLRAATALGQVVERRPPVGDLRNR